MMERQLPQISLVGTQFIVDVEKNEFREAGNPENKIAFYELRDAEGCYIMDFDPKIKNFPERGLADDSDVLSIIIPQLVELDPIGMAQKYGKTIEQIHGKTDIEVILDQETLKMRLKGQLPTVDLAGDVYYANIRADGLFPKSEFFGEKIDFTELDALGYWLGDENKIQITYNTREHKFEELDLETIISIPEDIIFLEFPSPEVLDPVGYDRKGGWDNLYVREHLVHLHFEARVIPWSETPLQEIIDKNLEKSKKEKQKKPVQNETGNVKKKKGRGL